MPFDPTKPADHSDLDAGEMRNQLNALNQTIGNVDQGANAALAAAISDTCRSTNAVALLNMTVSNPPQQWEVQALADKIDEMLNAQRR